MNETPASTTVRHNDRSLWQFGYVPTDDVIRAYDRMRSAELIRDSEARYLADVVVGPDEWRIPMASCHYRRAVANNDYARGVWEQVCERRGVAA